MTGWIVVGGESRDNKTFERGICHLCSHLFSTEEKALLWIRYLKEDDLCPKWGFTTHKVSDDNLPIGFK
jgi:hypothetical protein